MALVEKALRPELPLTSFLFGIALMPTLIWRRSKPLLMVLIAFVATGIVSAAEIVTGGDIPVPHTSVFMLLLPFALIRWGTGRDVAIGLPIVLTSASLGFVADQLGWGEATGGFGLLVSVMAIAMAVRYQARAREQAFEQVKLREREQLARDLHDTVAHHVSDRNPGPSRLGYGYKGPRFGG
jgi:signal transduction histidine kinase